MATQNSINSEFENLADGFSHAGGTTKRKVTVTGGDVTVTGGGGHTVSITGDGSIEGTNTGDQTLASLGAEPAKGSDDNYVTDTEKAALHAPHSDDQSASDFDIKDLTDSTNLRTSWAGKQDALGFTAENSANKGAANGYCPLGADSKIASAYMPPIAITSTSVVASEVAQLALTAQEGDVAVRSDLKKSYIHNGGTAGTMADWTELQTPTDAVLSVNGQAGTVSLDADDIADGSTNKAYTATEKTKLAGIATGAEVNVQPDWNQATNTEDDYIKNKPTIPTIPSMASASDINTGTDTTKTINADALAGSVMGTKNIQLKICDDATALTTGDGKIIFCIPPELNGMNLVDADAMVSTVSSSGTPTFQIRNVTDSVDMLSTAITIDASEFTSYTAATAPVIDTTKDDLATGDRIAIDCDTAGTGTKGATIILSFRLP